MRSILEGRVWTLGNNIDTDGIISGRYLTIIDPNELKKHVFEIALPEFAANAKPGDILVGGENFGCGSSREHAPAALKAIGVQAILADSFSRIFYRNSINLGLPAIEAAGVGKLFQKFDVAKVSLGDGQIANERTGASVHFPPIPPYVVELLEAGGLVEKVRRELAEQQGSKTAASTSA